MPAPTVNAIDASATRVSVTRFRFAFTKISSMLKPAMSNGSPATRSRRGSVRADIRRGAVVASVVEPYALVGTAAIPRRSLTGILLGQCQDAPPRQTGWAAGLAPRPLRIASTMTDATPAPMSTSPTLKTLAIGSHDGSAKMSVRNPRRGSSRKALLE